MSVYFTVSAKTHTKQRLLWVEQAGQDMKDELATYVNRAPVISEEEIVALEAIACFIGFAFLGPIIIWGFVPALVFATGKL